MRKRLRDANGRFKSGGHDINDSPMYLRLPKATTIAIHGAAARLDLTLAAFVQVAVAKFLERLASGEIAPVVVEKPKFSFKR